MDCGTWGSQRVGHDLATTQQQQHSLNTYVAIKITNNKSILVSFTTQEVVSPRE